MALQGPEVLAQVGPMRASCSPVGQNRSLIPMSEFRALQNVNERPLSVKAEPALKEPLISLVDLEWIARQGWNDERRGKKPSFGGRPPAKPLERLQGVGKLSPVFHSR